MTRTYLDRNTLELTMNMKKFSKENENMSRIELIGLVTVLALLLLWIPAVPAQKVQWSGNGHTYEAVLVPVGISWVDAKAASEAKGGHLATTTSKEENDFVYNLVAGDDHYWFLDSDHNGEGPWLGGYQPPDSPEPVGNWTWVTGEQFSYTNWVPGQPDNIVDDEDSLNFMAAGSLKGPTWNDVPNDLALKGYIIEWDQPQKGV